MVDELSFKVPNNDEKNIDVFQSKCLRGILKIRWQDRIINENVLRIAEMHGKPQGRPPKKEMKIHRPHYEERTKKRLWDLNTKMATKAGPADPGQRGRGQLEGERRAGWRSWSEVCTAPADRAG